MTHIDLHLATKLDGSETHMIAILVDSWADKLVIPLNCEIVIEPADFFQPCAHCGNAVLECNFEAGSDCCDRCTEGHKSGFVPTTMFQDNFGKRVRINEDRTEDIIRMMDECHHTHIETCTGICGISDICTKRSELIGVIPQMTVVKALREVKMEITNKTMEQRIKDARQEAEDAFWAVIIKHFPEAVDGQFMMSDMDEIMLSWVQHWVENNVPAATKVEPSWRGDLGELSELNLHYEDTWHLWHSGGGCMIASTDNVAVNGEYHFLCISMDCVCIYKDTFISEEFMMDALCCWSYGENPTVMMNQIDEFLGGPALWDTGKLFDDIMTIAKSKHM